MVEGDGQELNIELFSSTPLGDLTWMLLHHAAAAGDPALVTDLLSAGVSPVPPISGMQIGTPLHIACTAGHVAVAQAILEHAPQLVTATDSDRWTPLHSAAAAGHVNIIEVLVAAKSPLSLLDSNGATPLWVALRRRHIPAVRALRAAGATLWPATTSPADASFVMGVPAGPTRLGAMPLEAAALLAKAAGQGDVGMVQLLIDAGGDVDTAFQCTDKRTALHLAASAGHLPVVEALLAAGADPSPIDRWGGTPLQDAVAFGHDQVAERLLGAARAATARAGDAPQSTRTLAGALARMMQTGASGAAGRSAGRSANVSTALIVAAACGDVPAVSHWLSAGVNPDAHPTRSVVFGESSANCRAAGVGHGRRPVPTSPTAQGPGSGGGAGAAAGGRGAAADPPAASASFARHSPHTTATTYAGPTAPPLRTIRGGRGMRVGFFASHPPQSTVPPTDPPCELCDLASGAGSAASLPRALVAAVMVGALDVARRLLAHGADPNGGPPRTAAASAAESATAEAVDAPRVAGGASDASRDAADDSAAPQSRRQPLAPLHIALLLDDPAMVALLVEHGADADLPAHTGSSMDTPQAAARHAAAAAKLSHVGAVVAGSGGGGGGGGGARDVADGKLRSSDLIAAIRATFVGRSRRSPPLHPQRLAVLANARCAGAELRAWCSPWWSGQDLSVLHAAAGAGDVPVIELLLSCGLPAGAIGADGSTALHAAAHAGHLDVVALLLSAGACAAASDQHGALPCMLASRAGHGAVAALLRLFQRPATLQVLAAATDVAASTVYAPHPRVSPHHAAPTTLPMSNSTVPCTSAAIPSSIPFPDFVPAVYGSDITGHGGKPSPVPPTPHVHGRGHPHPPAAVAAAAAAAAVNPSASASSVASTVVASTAAGAAPPRGSARGRAPPKVGRVRRSAIPEGLLAAPVELVMRLYDAPYAAQLLACGAVRRREAGAVFKATQWRYLVLTSTYLICARGVDDIPLHGLAGSLPLHSLVCETIAGKPAEFVCAPITLGQLSAAPHTITGWDTLASGASHASSAHLSSMASTVTTPAGIMSGAGPVGLLESVPAVASPPPRAAAAALARAERGDAEAGGWHIVTGGPDAAAGWVAAISAAAAAARSERKSVAPVPWVSRPAAPTSPITSPLSPGAHPDVPVFPSHSALGRLRPPGSGVAPASTPPAPPGGAVRSVSVGGTQTGAARGAVPGGPRGAQPAHHTTPTKEAAVAASVAGATALPGTVTPRPAAGITTPGRAPSVTHVGGAVATGPATGGAGASAAAGGGVAATATGAATPPATRRDGSRGPRGAAPLAPSAASPTPSASAVVPTSSSGGDRGGGGTDVCPLDSPGADTSESPVGIVGDVSVGSLDSGVVAVAATRADSISTDATGVLPVPPPDSDASDGPGRRRAGGALYSASSVARASSVASTATAASVAAAAAGNLTGLSTSAAARGAQAAAVGGGAGRGAARGADDGAVGATSPPARGRVPNRMERIQLPTVADRDFERLEVIGQGAFGRIILACHTSTDFLFALKALNKQRVMDSGLYDACIAERDTLRAVKHPYIVGFHGAFQTESDLVLVLDYLPGGSLLRLLRRVGRLEEDAARYSAACVALAIDALHAQLYVYRDLKADNVVFDSDGHPVLIDFGLATACAVPPGGTIRDAVCTTLCGTPEYLAPEVAALFLQRYTAQGSFAGANRVIGGYGAGVDVWCLGVLTYQMLVGADPFAADDPVSLYRSIVVTTPTMPSMLSPVAKSFLTSVVFAKFTATRPLVRSRSGTSSPPRYCLTKNPSERPTIREVLQHEFFADLDLQQVASRSVPLPESLRVAQQMV